MITDLFYDIFGSFFKDLMKNIPGAIKFPPVYDLTISNKVCCKGVLLPEENQDRGTQRTFYHTKEDFIAYLASL
jgi:hypothetical protein